MDGDAVKPCEFCNQPFRPTRHWQRFCSNLCRSRWHEQERKKAVIHYRRTK